MKFSLKLLLLLLTMPTGVALAGGHGDAVAPDSYLEISTSRGDMYFQLYRQAAPVTTGNFLRYVDQGAFTNGSFYRTVRDDNQPDSKILIDVIQGGPVASAEEHPPIPLERTRDTGLRHLAGTLSMARSTPDTATAHFFICIEDEPELDFGGARNPDGQGFAAFGQLVLGMEVAKAIHTAPAEGQALVPVIPINGVREVAPIVVLAAQVEAGLHEPDFIGGLMPGNSRERVVDVLGLPARRESFAARQALETLGKAPSPDDLVYALRGDTGELQPVWLRFENGALVSIAIPGAE